MTVHEAELFEIRQVHPQADGVHVAEPSPRSFYVRCRACNAWLMDRDPQRAAQAVLDHRDGTPLGVGLGLPAVGKALPDPFGGVLVMTVHDAEEHEALSETLGELVRTTGAAAGIVLAEGEQLEVSTHDDTVRALAAALADGDANDPHAWEAWQSIAERASIRLSRAGWALVPLGDAQISVRVIPRSE